MGPSGPTSSCQPYRPALGPSGLHDFVFHAHQADDHHVSHLVHLLIGHLVSRFHRAISIHITCHIYPRQLRVVSLVPHWQGLGCLAPAARQTWLNMVKHG